MSENNTPGVTYSQEGSILTDKGLNLIAKILASTGKLEFTRAIAGDGTLSDTIMPETLTDVLHKVADLELAGTRLPGGGEASVQVQASSIGVTEGYFIREIGLFANDPTEGEILYAYVPLHPDRVWVRPQNSSINTMALFDIIVIVSRIESISARITPGALATVDELVAHNQDPGAHENRFAELNRKVEDHSSIIVIPEGEEVPVSDRKPNSFYIQITGQRPTLPQEVAVSPNMALTLENGQEA